MVIPVKKTTLFEERNEEQRQVFVEEIKDIPEESIVYVDESCFNEHLYREHCYALPGVKVIANIPGKKLQKTNIIAGYVNGSTIAELIYYQNTNTSFIEFWVEQFLVKALKPGQIVIWDNASFHKSVKVKEMIERAGCKLMFLPPYSPDLNPIEKFWANLKRYIRKKSKTIKTLWDAIVSFFVKGKK